MNEPNFPDAASIAAEYEESAQCPEDHQKVKWASSATMHSRFNLAMAQLPFASVKSWLDIGCGPGNFQAMVAERFPQLRCTGIDLSPTLLQHARERVETSGCRFMLRDIMELTGESFDIITCIGVLQRTNFSSRQFFMKVSPLLNSGGVLFLDTKNGAWQEFTSGRLLPDPHLQWFDPVDLRRQAEENGLTVLSVSGFDPHAATIVPLEVSHTLCLLASA